MTLLKKDANNAAAKKEVEEIKVLYRKVSMFRAHHSFSYSACPI